jgi:hypothetical protein
MRRGIQFAEDIRFCFTVFKDLDQDEAGDTFTHTFELQDWEVCQVKYFYFWGYVGAEVCSSTTAIFEIHRKAEDMIIYVKTLGKFGEEETLNGDVKLEEGANITLTRNDENNSLVIAAEAGEAPEYDGFRSHFLFFDTREDGHRAWSFDFDELMLQHRGLNERNSIYTWPMTTWSVYFPHVARWKQKQSGNTSSAPYIFVGMTAGEHDYWENENTRHIGFTVKAVNLHAVNGDGASKTDTDLSPLHSITAVWLRYERDSEEIRFYVDNALVATHNTNIPVVGTDCIWLWAMKGRHSYVNSIRTSCPLISES